MIHVRKTAAHFVVGMEYRYFNITEIDEKNNKSEKAVKHISCNECCIVYLGFFFL